MNGGPEKSSKKTVLCFLSRGRRGGGGVGAVSIFALWVRDLGHVNVPLVIRAAVVYLLKRKELLLVQGC